MILSLFSRMITGMISMIGSSSTFFVFLGIMIGGSLGVIEMITCRAQMKLNEITEKDFLALREELKAEKENNLKSEKRREDAIDRARGILIEAEQEILRLGQHLEEEEARRKALEDVVLDLKSTMKDELNIARDELKTLRHFVSNKKIELETDIIVEKRKNESLLRWSDRVDALERRKGRTWQRM